jgi:alpha-galactosidase
MNPLSSSHPQARFRCGDFFVMYTLDPDGKRVGLSMLPGEKEAAVVEGRKILETPEVLALPEFWQPLPAYQGEISLVQLKLREDDWGGHFSGGRTMRINPTVDGLRFVQQTVEEEPGGFVVRTELAGARHFSCEHELVYRSGDEAVTVRVTFANQGDESLTLEMLASFCLGGISPFDPEDSVERLKVHRFLSSWSAEGRHECRTLEESHLERSWASHSAVSQRFGQVGSLPVREYFPFLAVEDYLEGVFWAAQLTVPSSWQMEIFRRDDKVSLSGGLADREFGHWWKEIAPGERFTTPAAFLTVSTGDLDRCCQRLTRMQAAPLAQVPAVEFDLPVVFNEWCSSWGTPTPAFIAETAGLLETLPVKIFVIDDGWAEKPRGSTQFNGDWNVALERFPEGLAPVAADLRRRELIPGLWFELEVCTEGTDAFALPDHKLRRDGRILKVGNRQFWDFTDPWTFDYLTKKVIDRLRDDGFGYLKIDYNDTIGLGCDGAESLGEGLRRHLEGVQEFFKLLRKEIPDLIIEMCSSGGHRLEPSMLALASQASFSDAHESGDIPILAANVHRLILPRQSQIWAVLRPEDTLRRIQYSLAACFLGRVCLSGQLTQLSGDKIDLVRRNLEFYRRVAPIIRDGESRIFRNLNRSYRRPRGWQAVRRTLRPSADACLVVIHAFGTPAESSFEIPLPDGKWALREAVPHGVAVEATPTSVRCVLQEPDSAAVVHFTRTP